MFAVRPFISGELAGWFVPGLCRGNRAGAWSRESNRPRRRPGGNRSAITILTAPMNAVLREGWSGSFNGQRVDLPPDGSPRSKV